MTNTKLNGGCCGPIWNCEGSSQQPNVAPTPKFELKSPLGPCVPGTVAKSLPDFLTWFGSFGTPLICKMSELSTTKCSVLTGNGTDLVIKSFADMVAECSTATTGATFDCPSLLSKIAYNGTGTCIPNKTTETATAVMSVDQATGVVAWRLAPAIDCDILEALLKPSPASPGGCFPESTNVVAKVLSLTDTGAIEWIAPGTGTAGAPTCAQVKTALSSVGCIPDGTIAKVFGFDAGGTIVKGVVTGGGIETPITVIDTATVNMTAGSSGGGHTGLKADVIISPDAGNTLVSTPNGLFVEDVSCDSVKTALETNLCVSADTVVSTLGFNVAGKVVKQARRKLTRMSYRSADIASEIFTDTLANLGTRRIYKWQDYDSAIATLAPGQVPAGVTYDGVGSFTIGRSAVYSFSASMFVKFASASRTVNTSISVLAGWYVARPGLSALEFRFGEATQDLGNSDAIRNPSSDWFLSGTLQLYMPAGTIIRTRVWLGGPSVTENVTLTLDYRSPSSILSIAELPEYAMD